MEKATLRREARARLRAIPPAERAHAGREIARQVWELPEIASAGVLLLYASLPEEVPTDEIAREALRRGVGVVYPRTAAGGSMVLHRVADPAELQTGRFGIREPDPAIHPAVSIDSVDAALIPGLAWDRAGGRLGRGGGFYDRLLGTLGWRGFRCGIFFTAQEVPSVPAEPWDIALDAVVTDSGVWRFPSRTAGLPTT